MVPAAMLAGRCTVNVNSACSPAAIVPRSQMIGPVPLQAKPPPPVSDTSVVPDGNPTVMTTFGASVGPLFAALIANARSAPAIADPSGADATDRSANGEMYS